MPADVPQQEQPEQPSAPSQPAQAHTLTRINRIQLELPTRTIFRIMVAIVGVWLFLELRHLLLLIFMGTVLALVLDRPVRWLQHHGVRRGIAIGAILGTAIGTLVLLGVILGPPLADDMMNFWDTLPDYVDDGFTWLERNYPEVHAKIQEWIDAQQEGLDTGSIDILGILNRGLSVVTAIGNVIIVFIVSIYILADEGRSLQGLLRYVSAEREDKIRRTVPAVAKVVSGYVTGQSINSFLFGAYAAILLTVLDVPSAIVLALIAAVGDAIPQVGVTLATIPAVLLALTVSVKTGVIVLVAYILYQQIENYVIVPRVFGSTLGLSPLITMVAVLIGGSLLGIMGVLLALPCAAAVPVIAHIWLDGGRRAEAPTAETATGASG